MEQGVVICHFEHELNEEVRRHGHDGYRLVAVTYVNEHWQLFFVEEPQHD